MPNEFDVRPYLVGPHDMEAFEEEAEYAADQFNAMLFSAIDEMSASEFWTEERAEDFIQDIAQKWLQEPALLEAETDELDDYVRQLIRRIEQEQDGDE